MCCLHIPLKVSGFCSLEEKVLFALLVPGKGWLAYDRASGWITYLIKFRASIDFAKCGHLFRGENCWLFDLHSVFLAVKCCICFVVYGGWRCLGGIIVQMNVLWPVVVFSQALKNHVKPSSGQSWWIPCLALLTSIWYKSLSELVFCPAYPYFVWCHCSIFYATSTLLQCK